MNMFSKDNRKKKNVKKEIYNNEQNIMDKKKHDKTENLLINKRKTLSVFMELIPHVRKHFMDSVREQGYGRCLLFDNKKKTQK